MARQQWWTLAKQRMDTEVGKLGHTLTWKQLPREAGCALIFEGTCTGCGATVEVGNGSSSCATIRDARTATCSGPGTVVLTDIEQAHSSERFADLVRDYLAATDGAFD